MDRSSPPRGTTISNGSVTYPSSPLIKKADSNVPPERSTSWKRDPDIPATTNLTDSSDDSNCLSIREFIRHLSTLFQCNSPIVEIIKSPSLLLESLEELDRMIEMESVKQAIVRQLQFLTIKQILPSSRSSDRGSFEGHMLHTVIYGPPGTGKTRIGIILAKIWMSLGIIRKELSQSDKILQKHAAPIIIFNTVFEKIISNLQARVEDSQGNLSLIRKYTQVQQQRRKLLSNLLLDLKGRQAFSQQDQENLVFRLLEDMNGTDLQIFTEMPAELESNSDSNSLDDLVREARNSTEVASSDGAVPETFFKIVSRPDFVAEYLGQSAPKTRKLLEENRGKVLFIDEAYSLFNGETDSYGMEVLTEINRFMDTYPEALIIIWAGYQEAMENGIFRQQPGLRRRCTWFFSIEDYTGTGLAEIFHRQLEDNDWRVNPEIDLPTFFQSHKSDFPAFGGDTLKLCFFCKLAFSQSRFRSAVSSALQVNSIDHDNPIIPSPVPPAKLIVNLVLPPMTPLMPIISTPSLEPSTSLAMDIPQVTLKIRPDPICRSVPDKPKFSPPISSSAPCRGHSDPDKWKGVIIDRIITGKMLKTALDLYRDNRLKDKGAMSEEVQRFYN